MIRTVVLGSNRFSDILFGPNFVAICRRIFSGSRRFLRLPREGSFVQVALKLGFADPVLNTDSAVIILVQDPLAAQASNGLFNLLEDERPSASAGDNLHLLERALSEQVDPIRFARRG